MMELDWKGCESSRERGVKVQLLGAWGVAAAQTACLLQDQQAAAVGLEQRQPWPTQAYFWGCTNEPLGHCKGQEQPAAAQGISKGQQLQKAHKHLLLQAAAPSLSYPNTVSLCSLLAPLPRAHFRPHRSAVPS